ncbi:MAG: DUF4932 domain-containing protein [Thermoguttaceae bacterium]
MNRISQSALIVVLLFFAAATLQAAQRPIPKVDELVELVSLISRLAGANEYNQNDYKTYTNLLQERFGKFKEHPAVLYAKELRQIGVVQDAVMLAAISFHIDDGKIKLREGAIEQITSLDNRWNSEQLEKYTKLAEDFYQDSKFHDFFEEQKPLFQRIEQRAAEYCESMDYDWFAKFFGDGSGREFFLIFNLQCEGGFGPRYKRPDGTTECFAILGPCNLDSEELPALTGNDYLLTMIVHEYAHSFCNPLIELHWNKFSPSMMRYFPIFLSTSPHAAIYGLPITVQREIYVRAVVIRYFAAHENTQKRVATYWGYEKINGFLWIESLVNWLAEYEKRRAEFPTLNSFIPELVRRQDELVSVKYVLDSAATRMKEEKLRPKVKQFRPKNGAKNVDPSVAELSVTFDRPMCDGYAWGTMDHGVTFPKMQAGKRPQWSEDKKTCTIFVELEPNKTYRIWLTGEANQDFRSAVGDVPLKTIHYTFTTKE